MRMRVDADEADEAQEMTPEEWQAFRQEWREALPGIIAGEPDRTDLMIPLDRIVSWPKIGGVTLPSCLDIIEYTTGHGASELRSGRRYKTLFEARVLFFLLARDMMPHKTMSELGRFLGKDHTSVGHALKRGRWRLRTDPEFAERYQHMLAAATEREAER